MTVYTSGAVPGALVVADPESRSPLRYLYFPAVADGWEERLALYVAREHVESLHMSKLSQRLTAEDGSQVLTGCAELDALVSEARS